MENITATTPEKTLVQQPSCSRITSEVLRDVLGSTTSSLHELLRQFARNEEELDFVQQWHDEARAVLQEYHEALSGSDQQQWETYLRHSQHENDLLELRVWMKTHLITS